MNRLHKYSMKRSSRLLSEDLAVFMENTFSPYVRRPSSEKMIKWELQDFCEKTLFFFSEEISIYSWRRLYSSWSGPSALFVRRPFGLLWGDLPVLYKNNFQFSLRTICSIIWEDHLPFLWEDLPVLYEKAFQSCTKRPSTTFKELVW